MAATFLTTLQAAGRLGVADTYVRRLCRQGRLGRRIGRNWAITAADVEKFRRSSPLKRGPRKGQ
jgi:excisionase family DNA binding protein